MSITLRQIAQRAGVAPSTVSTALSPVCKAKNRVSKKRTEEIQILAKKMGYIPNISARELRTGKTHNIGVVIFSFLEHHPLSKYFSLVSEACEQRGYRAIPLQTHRKHSEILRQLHELELHHVDGLVFLDYDQKAYDQYLHLWQTNRAMIFRIRDPMLSNIPFDHVLVDHHRGSEQLLSHILSEGWSDIVFVTEEGNERGMSRYISQLLVKEQVQQHLQGEDFVRKAILYKGRTAQSRYEAVRDFVQAGRVEKGKTVLLLDGGDGSTGVYTALNDAGMVIGRDIAVAAMNKLPTNECVSPALTVISEPFEQVAEAMLKHLISTIEDKNEGLSEGQIARFTPEVIVGPSTARNKATNFYKEN